MNARILPLALLATAMSLHAQTAAKPAPHSAKDAAAVHASAIVIDTHADTPQRFVDDGYDLDQPGAQVNLPDAKKGNLGAEFFSIWVEPDLYRDHYAKRTLELIDSVYQQASKHPTEMRMAFSAADIEAAHREHKLAALMGIEGGHSIENSLALLRDYYRLGVRYMTLTWSNSNGWADSSGDINDANVTHTQEGLTEFGKDVVYEMNRLGMMVDISHVADKTFFRTLILTRAPVIASHSGSRALCNAPRNMTDDMLRAVANNGGVVQVNFFSAFVSQQYLDAYMKLQPQIKAAQAELNAKYKAEGKPTPYAEYDKLQREWAAKIPRPPFSALIDQIDHIAKVAGVDHVGIGSDFDGIPTSPEGMDTVADLPKISAALLQRGYSPEDVHKIMGGNLLRVFRQVEQVSRDLKGAEQRPRISQKQP